MPLAGERVFITGAGQVGRSLHNAVADAGAAAVELSPHSELDVTDAAQVARSFIAFSPTLVFHTAALTRVDFCERRPDLAQLVNAEGTANVVRAAAERQARMVYFSTDYVFRGRDEGECAEDDAPEPLNVYGRTKLAGEYTVLAYPQGMVIRTAQVFAPGGRNFLAALRAQFAEEGEPLRLVSDEIATPTYASHLAAATLALAERASSGVFHLRGPEELSYYEWAKRYFEAAGLPLDRLLPVPRAEATRDAPRPRRAVLGMRAYLGLGLPPLPALDEALQDYVHAESR